MVNAFRSAALSIFPKNPPTTKGVPMNRVFRLLLALALMSALLPAGTRAAPAIPWEGKVDPWVLQTTQKGESEFLVFLTEQADLSGAAALPTKEAKSRYVFEQLTRTAARTQGPLLSALRRMGVDFRPYWVANMVWVRGARQTVQTLAQRADVAHVFANPAVRLQQPAVNAPYRADTPSGIEWNISRVGAPQVWAQGVTGQGVVVAGQDTGYDWTHPALKPHYRGWNGAAADHNYNWHDAIHSGGGVCGADSPEPCDDDAHGTHTMGTMVGDDGGSNQIGMAPGAQWIGCRNMNVGVGTPTTYAECFQWFIAPTDLNGSNPRPDLSPDVINNSWGCPPSEGCTDPTVLQTVVENTRAAGIVVVVSAGNSGPFCSTVSDPAAIYDAAFSVGATSSSDTIASFSSRGPVVIDGSGRMKPDISAPGVSIRSSVPGGGYQGGWSGTSMAGPHVAGLVALLLSANPSLRGQVSAIENVITQSAVPRYTSDGCGGDTPTTLPNNTYGWGRIDAWAAYQALNLHTLAVRKSTTANTLLPGDTFTYTLTLTHTAGTTDTLNVVLSDTLPASLEFVAASGAYTWDGSTVRWTYPTLAPNAALSETLKVRVPANAPAGTITNNAYGASSDEAAFVSGSPVSVQVAPPVLTLSKTASAYQALPGQVLTYTLRARNGHEFAPLSALTLSDTLPAGAQFLTATQPFTRTGDVFTWGKADLPARAAWEVTLSVRVPLTAGQMTITNADYAAFSAETGKVTAAPVDVAVEPYALQAAAAPDVQYAPPGSPLTYTFTLTNPHPFAALSPLTLTVSLPPQASLVQASAPYTRTGPEVVFQTPVLAAGGAWTRSVTVSSTLTGTLAVTYTAESAQTAPLSGTVTAHIGALGIAVSDGGYTITTDPPRGTEPGIAFIHTITNTSAFTLTFEFALSDDLGWTTGSIPSVELGPGERFEIASGIFLPADAPAGARNHLRTVITSPQAPALRAEILDTLQVRYLLFLPVVWR
ncbi:MAG: hypothetical protein Fur0018_00770 [Anaerolineales bacterium]